MNGCLPVSSGTPHFQQNAPEVSTAAPQFAQVGTAGIFDSSFEPQCVQYGQSGWTCARHFGQRSGGLDILVRCHYGSAQGHKLLGEPHHGRSQGEPPAGLVAIMTDGTCLDDPHLGEGHKLGGEPSDIRDPSRLSVR